jgi:hypothetical protein
VPHPKPFVIKILVSKFFENKILRDTVCGNPCWARLSRISNQKFTLDIRSRKPVRSNAPVGIEIYFEEKSTATDLGITPLAAAGATPSPTRRHEPVSAPDLLASVAPRFASQWAARSW